MYKNLERFIREAKAVASAEELFERFLSEAKKLGINLASYQIVSKNLQRTEKAEEPIFNTFPKEWTDHYAKNKRFENDPLIALSRAKGKPFHWYDVDKYTKLSAAEKTHINELKERGFRDGIAIPVFGPAGTMSFFSLGSDDHSLKFTEEDMQLLQYMCQTLHQRYSELNKTDEQKNDAPAPKLSARERDVLQWVASGKSNSVIADILGISEHTVDTLLRRSYKKLGVSNRISAVLKGISYGIIQP